MPAAPMPAAPQHEEHYMEQHVQGPDGLIGEVTTSAISSTVGQLLRSITTDRTVAVSRGGLTIEDIVREEIKPMLKAWFDSHLPSLVERIVRAEIGRVIDRMEL
jgi:cell pole-organizing protein PopZ